MINSIKQLHRKDYVAQQLQAEIKNKVRTVSNLHKTNFFQT